MQFDGNRQNLSYLLKQLEIEAETLNTTMDSCPVGNYANQDVFACGEMRYWQPWAHFYKPPQAIRELLQTKLKTLFRDNWEYEKGEKVRPALGYFGWVNFDRKNKMKDYLRDDFIEGKREGGQFIPVDQTKYYPNHSSMHDYYNVATGSADFQEIYKRSYATLMATLKLKSKFGKYE